MTRSVEEQISRVPLYRRLTEQDRSELASVCHLESYERGSEVFAEGDPANQFGPGASRVGRPSGDHGRDRDPHHESVGQVEALEELSLN